jgi:hypothetical protein
VVCCSTAEGHSIRSGRQLQGIYNQSLDSGIAHGRQCNTVASKNLFLFLWSQMKDDGRGIFWRSEKLEREEVG